MTTATTGFAQEEIGFNPKNLPIPAAVAGMVALIALVAGLITGPGANSAIARGCRSIVQQVNDR